MAQIRNNLSQEDFIMKIKTYSTRLTFPISFNYVYILFFIQNSIKKENKIKKNKKTYTILLFCIFEKLNIYIFYLTVMFCCL